AASTRSSINWLVIGCGIALVAAFIWVTAGWQTFTNNQANQSWNLHPIDSTGFSGVIVVGPGDTVYLSDNTGQLQVNVQSGNGLILSTYSNSLTVTASSNEPEPINVQAEDGVTDTWQDEQTLKNNFGNIAIHEFTITTIGNDPNTIGSHGQDLCNSGSGISCTNS
ncbi:MAG: hypothetical protein ABSE17_02880, partial [Candidatus Levyibacteriota bacterium]